MCRLFFMNITAHFLYLFFIFKICCLIIIKCDIMLDKLRIFKKQLMAEADNENITII